LEITAIQEAFKQCFLPNDHLWVFGSRTDINKYGGDIDLYIETTVLPNDLFNIKIKFVNLICDSIGEQKIDAILNSINNSLNLPIYIKAKAEGVQIA
jgi:hypothetical protein